MIISDTVYKRLLVYFINLLSSFMGLYLQTRKRVAGRLRHERLGAKVMSPLPRHAAFGLLQPSIPYSRRGFVSGARYLALRRSSSVLVPSDHAPLHSQNCQAQRSYNEEFDTRNIEQD